MREDALRTTVELTDTNRERLLVTAARRKEKGFSAIVNEALDLFFTEDADHERRLREVLQLAGSISDETAERMHAHVRESRASWR
jgi:hypothetical protein